MPITIHFGRGLELFTSLLVGVLAVVLVAGSDGEFYRLFWFLILVVGGISRVLLYMLHRKRADTTKIYRDLHGQQPAVYEREITRQLFASNVLVSGLQGLGAEIAKNLVLSGVTSITLHDEENVELWDLSSNFLITEKDVGKNRALACVTKLQELSSTVTVLSLTRALSKEHLSNFQVVVFTNVNLEKAIEYDDYCHNHNPPTCFIRSEVRGLFGNVFCDFGPEFTVFDVDGEEPRTGIIASISNDNPAIVSSVDDEWLEFQDGDLVVFSEVEGMTELNDGKPRKIKKVGVYTFTLEEDTIQFGAYKRGGIVTQVKEPKVVKFKFLREALRDPGEYLLRDFSKFDRQALLHLAFQALDKFRHDVGRFPIAGSEDDAQQLITFAVNINESFGESKLKEIDKKILEQFAYGSHAILNPMAAVFGGIVGQEVVKACSGKFHPICQPSDLKPLNCRYDAQISVFGSKLQKRLEEAKIFVMGSGDWGCEFLKNLALMGVCCSPIGELTVTDDDSIEKSDRDSQLYFREWNIGEAKSTAANLINPSLNVKALEIRELAWTDDPFDREFWKGLDVVINALDNLKVRIYIDGPCACFQKPLLQSRTLGAKCNTQTIIPPLTENYGASLDPPEKFTLGSFPHNIDHCLTWARSEFEVLLEKTPSDVNDFLTDRQTAYDSFKKDLIQRILDSLGTDRCDTFQDCIRWARLRFEDYFCNRVKQLTFTFPEDASTSTGASFWSAPKRFPRPLAFSSNDPSHVQFIMAAAILSAEIFGIPIPEWAKNSKKLADVVDKVIVPDFQPKSRVKNEPDYSYIDDALLAIIDYLNDRLDKCANKVPSGFCMNPIQFKMDDDTNYHMDFIAGLANRRARNCSIPQVDKLKDKLIVGRIIPVIATSTAMAAGLVCLELYKVLAGGHRLEDYRNTFANLALAQFCMAEPVPPKMKYWFGMPEWDLWTIKGDPTLRELLQWFNGRGLNAYRIYNRSAYDIYNQTAYGGTTLLYNHSFHYPLNRMDKKVVDLVRQIDRVPPYRDHVDLKVACEDACGNNGYIPHVLIYFR